MNHFVSIDEFNQGWKFFTKKTYGRYGKFPCSEFSCSGCDDWLDCENHNRNFYKLKAHDKQIIQSDATIG